MDECDVQRMAEEVRLRIEASAMEQGKERLRQAVLPSVRLKPVSDAAALGGSKIGGAPDLPSQWAWPYDHNKPLAFLAQINLADIASLPIQTGLPETGLLYFFYDAVNQPWGEVGEEGGWRILYHQGPVTELRLTQPPAELPKEVRFPARAVAPEVDVTLPHPFTHLVQRDLCILGPEYWRLYESLHPDQVCHRMFGNPQKVQDDVFMHCQLAHYRLSTDLNAWFDDETVERLLPGAQDWRLLLQIDSDNELGMMWGDVGSLFFCIREDDLRQRRFDKTWVVLQCF